MFATSLLSVRYTPPTANSDGNLSSLFCRLATKDYICRRMKLIEMNIDKIVALCKKYKVARLWVFGSILTPRFNDDSDIDFLVDFDEKHIELLDYADNFFNFIHEIESVVGRKVDMIVNKSVKNRFFRTEIDETRRLLWSAQ